MLFQLVSTWRIQVRIVCWLVKGIFHYLKGTIDFVVLYKAGAKENLFGFSDSDYIGGLEDRKSTLGFFFMMSFETVSWLSKKQQTLSSKEAQFVVVAYPLVKLLVEKIA